MRESASGGSMTIRGAGSLASGTTGAAPRTSLALCAIALEAQRTAAAPINPMNARLMTVLLGAEDTAQLLPRHMLAKELSHQLGDGVTVRLQGEVACVDQVVVQRLEVALVGL